MPKRPSKDSPKCPFCSYPTIRWGTRPNKHRTIQKYRCKNCKKHFTNQPNLQKHKTYPISIILNAVSNLNLGYSLKQTANYFKKHNLKKSTLSCWYNQLKTALPYHRIRNQIRMYYKPADIIKKRTFIHHNHPFRYQYYKPKVDLFLKQYPALRHYLENIETILPKGIFTNSQRISKISKETQKTWLADGGRPIRGVGEDFASQSPTAYGVFRVSALTKKLALKIKENYATTLANIALQLTEDNKERHQIVEDLMLRNDTATLAVEIPVYLDSLTGHMDILQIRFNKLHILDFKPETINKKEAIAQLSLYANALSRITNIPLTHVRCAFFNNENYFEFCPNPSE